MKLSCNQNELSKALSIVSKAVSQKEISELHKGILFKAENDRITLSALQPELGIVMSIEADVEIEGALVFPSKLFSEIVRKLPNSDVFLKENGKIVEIKCGSSKFNIVGMEADEFPEIERHLEGDSLEFKSADFSEMIKKTAFSASTDQLREILTGLYMEFIEESLNVVSLDGFRMSVAYEKCKNIGMRKVLVSAKIMADVSRIIAEIDTVRDKNTLRETENDEKREEENKKGENIRITIGEKKLLIEVGNAFIIINTMEGTYLKYRDLIPKQFKTELLINKREFHEAIERAAIFIDEKRNTYIKLIIEEMIVITSRSEEGNVREEVEIERIGNSENEENMEIGFDVKYLSDVLKVIPDEDIIMKLNTPTSPCVIEPALNKSCIYMVLPVRIA